MVTQTRQRSSLIESLEERTFLSAPADLAGKVMPARKAATTYSFARLNGYDQRGATWKYSTSATVTVGSQRRSATANTTVTVNKNTVAYDGHSCNLVVTSGGNTSTTKVAWYTNSSGTYATANIVGTDMGQFDMRLHDSRVAPAAMLLKQTYTDTGTFDGTFSGGVSGQRVTGTVRGNDSVSSQLIGQETITVPAGTFNAIKGVWTMKLSGQMTLHAAGQTANATFVMNGTSTFWSVSGKGMIKGSTSMKISLSIAGQGSATVNMTGTSVMTSFTPAAVKVAAKRVFAADDRPIL